MLELTKQALLRADAVLFMIDGREGVTGEDLHFAKYVAAAALPRCAAVPPPPSPRGVCHQSDGFTAIERATLFSWPTSASSCWQRAMKKARNGCRYLVVVVVVWRHAMLSVCH